MTRKFHRSLFLLCALTIAGNARGADPAKTRHATDDRPPVHWLAVTNDQFSVCGLPWFKENGGELYRLPARDKDSYRPAVWSLAESPSGGRIRFRTDSRALRLELEYPSPPNMRNMQAFGQTGLDVYVDGHYVSTAIAPTNAAPGKIIKWTAFNFWDRPAAERDITIYLPLYKGLTIHGIGLIDKAEIKPAPPFRCDKPVVFYGTSITQGGVASRPAMDYPAMLGRKLNIDYVNLGFSGNGLGDPAVARAMGEIDAACYVLDFGVNHKTYDAMEKTYAPFVAILRQRRPTTPILAISPIYTTREARSMAFKKDWQRRRDLVRDVVAQCRAHGDQNIEFVDGTQLLGPDRADGLVDGTHPNDLGFSWMTEGLTPILERTLKLQ